MGIIAVVKFNKGESIVFLLGQKQLTTSMNWTYLKLKRIYFYPYSVKQSKVAALKKAERFILRMKSALTIYTNIHHEYYRN